MCSTRSSACLSSEDVIQIGRARRLGRDPFADLRAKLFKISRHSLTSRRRCACAWWGKSPWTNSSDSSRRRAASAPCGAGRRSRVPNRGLESPSFPLFPFECERGLSRDTHYSSVSLTRTISRESSTESLRRPLDKRRRASNSRARELPLFSSRSIKPNAQALKRDSVSRPSPWPYASLAREIDVVPVRQLRVLQLMWPLPPRAARSRAWASTLQDSVAYDQDSSESSTPELVISHLLGHEGASTLHSALRALGYVDSLSCGVAARLQRLQLAGYNTLEESTFRWFERERERVGLRLSRRGSRYREVTMESVLGGKASTRRLVAVGNSRRDGTRIGYLKKRDRTLQRTKRESIPAELGRRPPSTTPNSSSSRSS